MRCFSFLTVLVATLWCAMVMGQETFNKSWIWIDPVSNSKVMRSGDTWEVPIEYELDASEAARARTIEVFVPGPWIDGPDGKYTKERFHVMYPGMYQTINAKPGRHREVVRFTIPPAHANGNSLLVIAAYSGPQGRWPWEVRKGGPWFGRSGGFIEIESDVPGHLFTYDEPVQFRVRVLREDGAGKSIAWRVTAPGGAVAAQGQQAIGDEREVTLAIDLKARGIFLLEAEVDGWEKRMATFGRIPDVGAARTEKTLFGMTDVIAPKARERLEAEAAIARRLGLSACRIMARWDGFEPAKGLYKFDAWEAPFDVAKEYGIEPVLMVDHPPAWAQRGRPSNIQYAPFEADWEGWQAFVEAATKRFGDRLYAWEWLNEIVPGDDPNAVENYLKFSRIGTETARKIKPEIVTTAAGGLWPRSFRVALLAGGLAQHVDVLPVHYSDGSGVRQARSDLRAIGAELPIWDNETAAVLNAWDVPKLEQIADESQPRYLLTRWTDCLTAGAERIFWFGGQGDPAGNWSYLLDDHTPRPVAVTMAVFVSKVHGAKALGAFTLGNDSKLHLFERDGKSLVIAWAPRRATVEMPAGAGPLTRSDYLGNETRVSTADGLAELTLTSMPIFIEGADLEQLKFLTALRSVASEDATQTPRLTLLDGRESTIQLAVSNPLSRELTADLKLARGEETLGEMALKLAPGEARTIALPVKLAAQAEEISLLATLNATSQKMPEARVALVASVVAPELLGNLLPNGDLEAGEGNRIAGWNGRALRVSSEGLGEGLGDWVAMFEDTPDGFQDMSRSIPLAGGQTYLYSAWVRNEDMQAGSNVGLHMRDGTSRILYNVQVFVTPPTNLNWHLYTAKVDAPEELVSASFSPVVKGAGFAMFDNLRVTRYEGTDYMAEAHRVKRPITVDADLSDWEKRCPIPLLGANQLTAGTPRSPENLSAVGYLAWDESNLYLAVRVRDDRHVADRTGDDTPQGDSVVIAIDPTGRKSDAAERAFAYYLSAAIPGGGSGKYTLYRPAARSGGLSSGHLLKDSSLYDLAIRHEDGVTTYEARFPWSELGITGADVGTRMGVTLQVNDNDGAGQEAQMHWGGGIVPTWAPMTFGLVTLLD